MIKTAYSVFVGILLALFVGLGIAAFYTQPYMPEWPTELNMIKEDPTDKEKEIQKKYDDEQKAWEEKMKPYNRNVSLITLGAAVVLVAISMFLVEHKYSFFSDGTMFGGVFTLFYSVGRGFAAQDSKYSFILTTAGIVILFVLGHKRFIRVRESS